MAKNKETAEVEVKLSVEDAQRKIKELTKASDELSLQLAKMGKDDVGRKETISQLNKIDSEVTELRKSLKTDLRVVINGEAAGVQLRELKAAQIVLTREMALFGDQTDPIYIRKAEQLRLVSTRIVELEAPIREAKKGFISLGEDGSMNQLKARAAELRAELDLLNPSAQKAKLKLAELDVVSNTMRELTASTELAKAEFVKIGEIGSLTHLEAQAKGLREQISELTVGTKAWVDKAKDISAVDAKIEEAKNAIKSYKNELAGLGADGSFNRLKIRAEELDLEIRKLTPSTQEFINKTRELQQVEGKMKSLNSTIEGTSGLYASLVQQIKQFGPLVVSYLGLQALTGQITNIINKNAELSDSLADVRQTTSLTEAQVKALNLEFSKWDTRTATKDLRTIAEVGGQFNVAETQLLGFTDAVNKVTVVLKKEFKGGAEEITTTLAGLRNVLTDIKSADISDDLLKIGNGLITLANKGNATGPVVSDIANRISGFARAVDISSGKILGLSATVQELNINAERGGTAVAKILQKMTTNTAEFAKIAGVSLKDFQKQIREDAFGAFVKFLEGTKQFKGDAIAMGGALKELETTGGGVTEVLSKLGSNTLLLADKVKVAEQAITNTDAITEKYAIKNDTLGAQIDKLGKKIYGAFSNDTINKFFISSVSGVNKFLDSIKSAAKFINDYKEAIILTVTTLITFSKGADLAKSANERLANLLTGTVSDALDKAKKGFEGLWTAMKANPAGAIILALEIATTVFFALRSAQKAHREELERASKAQNEFNNLLYDSQAAVDADFDALKKAVTGSKERSALIDEINNKYKDYLPNLLTEKTNLNEISLAQAEVNKKLRENIILQDARDKTQAFLKQKIELEDQLRNVQTGGFVADANGRLKSQEDLKAEIKLIEGKIILLAKLKDDRLEDTNAGKNTESFTLPGVVPPNIETTTSNKTSTDNTITTKIKVEGEDDARKQLEQYQAKLKQLYIDLERVHIDVIKDEAEKELANLDFKYNQEKEKATVSLNEVLKDAALSSTKKAAFKEAADNLALAKEEQYQQERKELITKYTASLAEAEFKQDIKNLDEWITSRKLAITTSYADEKITKEQFESQLQDLELRSLELKLKIAEDYGKSTKDIELAIADFKANIRKKEDADFASDAKNKADVEYKAFETGQAKILAATIEAIRKKRDAEIEAAKGNATEIARITEEANIAELSQWIKFLNAKAEAFEAIYSRFSAIVANFNKVKDNKQNAELIRDKRDNDTLKNNYKKQLDSKIITQDQYNDKVQKLDDAFRVKESAAKREQWIRNKKAARSEAIIQGIVSVVKTLAQYSYPYNLILAALDAVVVGSQVAAINSEPEPEFRFGKKPGVEIGKGGVPDGPSHSAGGIALVDSKSGKKIGEMEGGEAIIPEKTSSEKIEIINDLLENGGANVMMRYRDGGIVPSDSSDNLRVLQALNEARYKLQVASPALQVPLPPTHGSGGTDPSEGVSGGERISSREADISVSSIEKIKEIYEKTNSELVNRFFEKIINSISVSNTDKAVLTNKTAIVNNTTDTQSKVEKLTELKDYTTEIIKLHTETERQMLAVKETSLHSFERVTEAKITLLSKEASKEKEVTSLKEQVSVRQNLFASDKQKSDTRTASTAASLERLVDEVTRHVVSQPPSVGGADLTNGSQQRGTSILLTDGYHNAGRGTDTTKENTAEKIQRTFSSFTEEITNTVNRIQRAISSFTIENSSSIERTQRAISSFELEINNSVERTQRAISSFEEDNSNSVSRTQRAISSFGEEVNNTIERTSRSITSFAIDNDSNAERTQREISSLTVDVTNSIIKTKKEVEEITDPLLRLGGTQAVDHTIDHGGPDIPQRAISSKLGETPAVDHTVDHSGPHIPQRAISSKAGPTPAVDNSVDHGGPDKPQRAISSKENIPVNETTEQYVNRLLKSTTQQSFTSIPKFATSTIPPINTQRIAENLKIERVGYSNATGNFAEKVLPPDKTAPNSNQSVSSDPFQQEMLKTMDKMNVLLDKSIDFWDDPNIQAIVSLTDLEKKKALRDRVKENSQVGTKK